MTRWTWLLLAVLALAAACGGKENKSSQAPPAGAGGASMATVAPTEAARPAATPTPADTSGGQVVAADCLKSVRSYRYSGTLKVKGASQPAAAVALDNVRFSGAFVAPDRSQAKVELAGQSFETVRIGADTWTRFGTGDWVKGNVGGAAPLFSPDDFCSGSLVQLNRTDLARAGVKATKERVNGMDALRYEFDKQAIQRLERLFGGQSDLQSLPDNLKLTLWVTEKEHWPVKVVLSGEAKDRPDQLSIELEYTITDLNKEIRIEPPR